MLAKKIAGAVITTLPLLAKTNKKGHTKYQHTMIDTHINKKKKKKKPNYNIATDNMSKVKSLWLTITTDAPSTMNIMVLALMCI